MRDRAREDAADKNNIISNHSNSNSNTNNDNKLILLLLLLIIITLITRILNIMCDRPNEDAAVLALVDEALTRGQMIITLLMLMLILILVLVHIITTININIIIDS